MDPRIQQVLNQMETDFQQHLSLSKMAKSVNLSPSRMSHLFKAETGVTPTAYLKSLRMKKARELFENSWLSVKEITARIGWSDESNFVHEFKKAYGLTPFQYRQRYLANLSLTKQTRQAG